MWVRWVTRQLRDENRAERVNCCTELHELNERDNTFVDRLITGDETWIRHYELESERHSMQWRHRISPNPKKFKWQKSAGKVIATILWDVQGLILLDFLPRGETINSKEYIENLRKPSAGIRRVKPNKRTNKFLI